MGKGATLGKYLIKVGHLEPFGSFSSWGLHTVMHVTTLLYLGSFTVELNAFGRIKDPRPRGRKGKGNVGETKIVSNVQR